MVSVVILVHNALEYVKKLINSRHITTGVDVEWVVVDNGSDDETASYLRSIADIKLIRSDTNLYFAAGNNLGVKHASGEYVLLLNSDVEILEPIWLSNLLAIHKRGVAAYGCVPFAPIRADGYCFMIDKDLYHLDEEFEWWWSITKLQADLLRKGYSVQAIEETTSIKHYGQGSGPTPKHCKGMDIGEDVVSGWFDGMSVNVIKHLCH